MNYLYIYFPLERRVQAAISVRLPGPLIGCDRGGGDDVTFVGLFVRFGKQSSDLGLPVDHWSVKCVFACVYTLVTFN